MNTDTVEETRYYRNADGLRMAVPLMARKPANEWTTYPEGRLYLEITAEAFESILNLAGYERDA